MEKDQIVRKCLSNGTVIGGYWQVVKVKRPNLVLLQSLVSERLQEYTRKDRLHICTVAKIIISHRVYERVENEAQYAIIHDPTKKWLDLFKKQPEMVQLRSELYNERIMLFNVDQVLKVNSMDHGVLIRLELGDRIL